MLSIIIAKFVFRILRLLGKGATSLPGKIALKIKPNILNRLSRNVKIICVTGTNGKTTTCALLEHYFKENNLSYFVNKSGANMISGVASAFIENSSVFGNCRKEYAILECDENSLPLISRYLDAEIVVVTNIFRDQLDRYGEVTHIFNQIKKSILNMPNASLVLNGDCPLTYSLSKYCNNPIFTFGTNLNTNEDNINDNLYCPICSNKLRYKTNSFAQLGNYYCTNCKYSRPKLDFVITDLIRADENGSAFLYFLNRKMYQARISLGGIYNLYNYCAASLTLLLLGQQKLSVLSSFNGSFGRMESFKAGNKSIRLMLVKNPVGFSQCVEFASKLNGKYNYVFSLNDNSADGTDVSWIWNTSFDNLLNNANNIYTIGTRAYDMAIRLKYESMDISGIINGENYQDLLALIEKISGDFVVFATYTSMMKMRHLFIEKFGGKEFWN